MGSSFQIIEKNKFSHKGAEGPKSRHKRTRYCRGQGSVTEKGSNDDLLYRSPNSLWTSYSE
jgi:hypothetical protein